ncbi:DUF1064 domain-containing protein [Rhizobium laguerreae]|uniref:DUF1064 domain-containing protein n=1 Tax=Rhizobium laguerreae TaxID=1076926 RepID=A0A7Y2W8U7_9HYPH|nr:DUF1064 domain-containing protein [Rhizobium laguerreae]NNH67806.1 DUF1064 domain-containing protein [Rhizobium laguerreae]
MTINLSRQEAKALLAKPKRSKYGAQKTMVDGILFDSKREAAYYSELKIREKAGEVSGVALQRPFPIIIAGTTVGKYVSDFAFIDHLQDRRLRIIDVKGFDTPLSRFKRKCVEAFYQIKVEIIR